MSAPAILLVDDEPVVLQAMARTLSRRGHRVLTADSAAAARTILQEDEVAVLISDQRLGDPDPDGVELLTQVRQRWPLVERVLLTGFADIPSMERAINEAGVSRFLSKPWEDVDLWATVNSALDQWQDRVENRHLLAQLAENNRRLEEAVAARTRELSATQALWERAFDAISEPVMVIDQQFRLVRGNHALRRHLRPADREHTERRPVGAPDPGLPTGLCHELRAASRHPLPRSPAGPCVGCPVAATYDQERRTHAEAELTSERAVLVLRTYPLEQYTVCVYHDATRERSALRKLQVTDRLAAIGQLAGGVAHELNNPLGGILASAQLLLRDLRDGHSDPDAQDELLAEIEDAARRCKGIVASLLRFSRAAPDLSRRTPVDLNRLVQAALPLCAHQYELRGVHLRCQLDPGLPTLLGIEAQLQQVLMTLLGNAFDANRELARAQSQIIVTTATGEGAVLLTVADEGPGFREEQLAQLFTPFYSTKSQGEGTGLGLAVAYGIVRDHRGTLEARNREGGGAELRVTLPLS